MDHPNSISDLVHLQRTLNTLSESELQTIRDHLLSISKTVKDDLVSQIMCLFLRHKFLIQDVLLLVLKKPTPAVTPKSTSMDDSVVVDLTNSSNSFIKRNVLHIQNEDITQKPKDEIETKIATKSDLETQTLPSPPPIPKNSSRNTKQQQSPKLPLQLGHITTLHSLGRVVHDRLTFHDESDIFPVGYKVSRMMPSLKNEKTSVEYYGEILDGGQHPVFRITCSDDPSFCIESNSSSGAWRDAMSMVRKKTVHVSGPMTFGFRNILVVKMIQELPGVEKCVNYNPAIALEKAQKSSKRELQQAASMEPSKKSRIETSPTTVPASSPVLATPPHREKTSDNNSMVDPALNKFLSSLDAEKFILVSQELLGTGVASTSMEELARAIGTKYRYKSLRDLLKKITAVTLRKIGTFFQVPLARRGSVDLIIDGILETFDPATKTSSPVVESSVDGLLESEDELSSVSSQEEIEEVVGKASAPKCTHPGPCQMLFGSCVVVQENQ